MTQQTPTKKETIEFFFKDGTKIKDMSKVRVPIDIQKNIMRKLREGM